jgi:hypothetical protein
MDSRSVIVFGAGLLVVAWLGARWKRESSSGVLDRLPAWLRRLVGSHDGRVQLDDLSIGIVGLLWLLAGVGLGVSGQSEDSSVFIPVLVALVVLFLVGGLVAFAVSVRRLAVERHR